MEQWDEKGSNSKHQLNVCYHFKALQTFPIIPLNSDEYDRALFQPVANLCPKLYAHLSNMQDNIQYLIVTTL